MDVVGAFVESVVRREGTAPALAFVAGLVTAAGPCLGTRLASVTALTAGLEGARRVAAAGTFVSGIVASYVLIGSSSALWWRIAHGASWTYAALAVGLGVCGIRALVQVGAQRSCAVRACAPRMASLGSAFLSGASFALVASPCCTPILATIAGVAAKAPSPFFGMGVAGAFALGHTAPVFPALFGSGRLYAGLRRHSLQRPASIVAGGVVLALGGYYALLA